MDWRHWYERWEAMQACYIVQREHRFDLMLRLPGLPRTGDVQILDLGCGPGSLVFRALRHYPNTRVVAVDADPVLLAMGQGVAGQRADRIQFLQADIRGAEWWTAYDEAFDLVLSATTLHWLSPAHLKAAYRRIYRALKPAGWFMNSDHMASDDPAMQARYQQILQAKQETAFRATGADDWDGFWQALAGALRPLSLQDLWREMDLWEGTDDGHPKQFHLDALRQCGFEQVEVCWQDLGEAVIGAAQAMALQKADKTCII